MVVSPLYAIMFRSCELPIMIKISYCNATCCVCWDPMNIEYYVKLIINLSYMLFMILHSFRY